MNMTRKGRLFLVCGYVASGKTKTADLLAEVTGSNIIRTDDIRKELFPEELDYGQFDLNNTEESAEKIDAWIRTRDPRNIDFQQILNPLFAVRSQTYGEIINKYADKIKEQKEEVYSEAFRRLDKGLAEGKNMLFDATFSKREMREKAYQTAIRNGVKKVYIIQIVCDEEIIEDRLAKRRSGVQATTSNAKQLEVFRIVKKEFDESRIQNDNPSDLNIIRIVYNTGSQEVFQFGKADVVTEKIRKDAINVLSKKYK